MRRLIVGLVLAAVPAGALAQWGSFEAGTSSGVGLQASDGSQLLLKCDKPGKGEVYVAIVTPKNLVPPASSYTMRPVKVRFDDGPVKEDRWRFYTQSAVAIDKGNERSLSRFLAELVNAKKVKVTMEPGNRTPSADATFDVDGVKEAIGQAYEGCKDESPIK